VDARRSNEKFKPKSSDLFDGICLASQRGTGGSASGAEQGRPTAAEA